MHACMLLTCCLQTCMCACMFACMQEHLTVDRYKGVAVYFLLCIPFVLHSFVSFVLLGSCVCLLFSSWFVLICICLLCMDEWQCLHGVMIWGVRTPQLRPCCRSSQQLE